MVRFALALGLLLAAVPAWAVTVSTDLACTSATSTENVVNLTFAVEVVGFGAVSQLQTMEVTGNLLVDVDLDFDPATHAVSNVNGLTITGGQIWLSDAHYALDFGDLLGQVHAQGDGIGATAQTPSPPSHVVAGQFNGADHRVITNAGVFHVYGEGPIFGAMTPFDADQAADPLTANGAGTGTIAAALAGISGAQATYNVNMTLPVAVPESNFLTTVIGGYTVRARVWGDGLLAVSGQFSRTISRVPGDANDDGTVDKHDAALVAANWLKTSGVGWGQGDFNGDGHVDDLDLAVLAANWRDGSGPTAAVPEPSLAAILAGAILGGFLLCRRAGR
ncbi:MAG: hypothetical protein JW809_18890 [Pirellulales bacterium]|nr:hypothetical protein [Pirellulales bacterium]